MTHDLDVAEAEAGYQEDAQRALHAAGLKQNPLLGKILDELEELYTVGWKTSPARDNDGRERLFLAVQIVGKVRAAIDQAIEDGRVSSDNLRALAEQQAEAPPASTGL